MENLWDKWVAESVEKLEGSKLLLSLRTMYLKNLEEEEDVRGSRANIEEEYPVFNQLNPWDRTSVEMAVSEFTFNNWVNGLSTTGEEIVRRNPQQKFMKLLAFSGNDYLGLSAHPAVRNAAAKAAREHGMGPRGSLLGCGYTNYHRMLETSLANSKKKEDCVLCPTGYAANEATLVAIGSVAAMLSPGEKPGDADKVAIFSDSLNHASIIDGMRLAEKQGNAEVFVYRHADMSQLDALLSRCPLKKKVVVTDSLFSMEGDLAPMDVLVKLRKKYGFLLVMDDAHGSFVFGENGGGVAELFDCEDEVDIVVGTLSKATGCLGGFIACSKNWKKLIQSKGRSLMFSTSMPIPLAAAAHAAVVVAKKEKWRRKAILDNMREFTALSGVRLTSPIVSLVVGTEEKAIRAGRHMLESGFHTLPVRPPVVPPNSCRLRVTLTAAHTKEDIHNLIAALSEYINFQDIVRNNSNVSPKL